MIYPQRDTSVLATSSNILTPETKMNMDEETLEDCRGGWEWAREVLSVHQKKVVIVQGPKEEYH